MSNEWEFAPEEEIGIPDGARVVVSAIENKDGEIISQRVTKTGKPLINILFAVQDGDYAGRRCSLTLWPNTTDRRFRTQFSQITGIDLDGGARGGVGDLTEALNSFSYEVELTTNDRGYTDVVQIHGRVPKGEAVATPSIATAPAAEGSDEDIPF